ncbi:MAG: arsenic metallochaperone ArsD family protein, partial [Rhodocyclales bacterium]|nr:arsenic metallochaperone ArsD family protein [Rhodocyclales bacterium]
FQADLQALEASGVEVVRHSLSHDPAAFAAHAEVVKEMEAGMDRLPIIVIDGHVVVTGMYPSRAQLAQKLGLPAAGAAKKVIGIGTAPGCNPKSGCC